MRKSKTNTYCADFETTSETQYKRDVFTKVYLWKIMGVDTPLDEIGLELDDFFKAYNNTKLLVVREREIISLDRHIIKAQIRTKEGKIAEVQKEAQVLERIGGGDAFAAGIIHGILNYGNDFAGALNFAADCFVMKATLEGDVLYMNEREIKAAAVASSKDVKR